MGASVHALIYLVADFEAWSLGGNHVRIVEVECESHFIVVASLLLGGFTVDDVELLAVCNLGHIHNRSLSLHVRHLHHGDVFLAESGFVGLFFCVRVGFLVVHHSLVGALCEVVLIVEFHQFLGIERSYSGCAEGVASDVVEVDGRMNLFGIHLE